MNGPYVMALRVEVDDRVLHSMAKHFPKMFEKAHGVAADTALRQLKSVLNGGGKYTGTQTVDGVRTRVPIGAGKWQKHHPITTQLKGHHKIYATKTFTLIKYIATTSEQVIGWPTELHKFMAPLQEKSTRPITDKQRRWFRWKGVQDADIPAMYERPERKLVDPLVPHFTKNFPIWCAKVFQKRFKKKFGRAFVA